METRDYMLNELEEMMKCGIAEGVISKYLIDRTRDLASLYDVIRTQHVFFSIMKKKKFGEGNDCINLEIQDIDVEKEAEFLVDIFLNGAKNYGGGVV